MSKKIVIANWKMNPMTLKEAGKLFAGTVKLLSGIRKTQVVVCPPFIYLEKLKKISAEIMEIFRNNGITAQYINYCSLDFEEWETAYYGTNYSRLQEVKKKYDINNLIRHPQSIKA